LRNLFYLVWLCTLALWPSSLKAECPVTATGLCTPGVEETIVIDEIEMYGSNTDELVNEIYSRFPGTKIFAYPDPSAKARKSSAGGRTDLSILANAGFIVKAPNKHMPVRDRINSVNSKLCNGNGERGILIHPKCKKLISCLERQIYKPGTSQPDKDSGHDHMNDALGYGVSYLFPITRQYNVQPQVNWSVRIAK